MNDILVFNIARLAVKSMLNAGAAWPKPGLVTPLADAAGTAFQTIVEGALGLLPCFINCASIGLETEAMNPEDVMTLLRPAGMQGEREVQGAVRGRTSFKGSIFFLGLFSAAAGRLFAQERNLTPLALALTASSCVRGLVERELRGLDEGSAELTPGERAWTLYGVDGARGEAERGFPVVVQAVDLLRQLEEGDDALSGRERAAQALLGILAGNSDSALAERAGLDGMLRVQAEAKAALLEGGVLTSEGRKAVDALDRRLREADVSPRGAEIALAAALFVRDLEALRPTRSGREE